MAVFFKRFDAAVSRLLGVFTIIAAVFVAGDGYIIGPIVLAAAGVVIWGWSSGQNSALYDFGVKLAYFALVFVAGVIIVGL